MINFKQYFSILLEGGNVFKNHPTVRIDLPDIQPTVDFLSRILGINLNNNLLGSTGKRPSSGDLDIGIPETKYSKDDIYQKLLRWCEERNLNPKDYIAKSGISVHFRTPIYGKEGEYVQTDFMLVPDMKFAKFALANNEQAPFKGMHRNVVLSNLAKNLNLKFAGIKGLVDRTTNALIEDKNPDRVAQILLGSQNAKGRDLESITNILKFLYKKYKDANVVLTSLQGARETILKDGLDIAMLLGERPINESISGEGQRVGVQHLYSQYKSEDYSMSFENFKRLLYTLKSNGGIIEPGNSTISEKADGLAVRFGLSPEKKFFLQGSYSGPVYTPNFEGKIKHEPTKKAFEENFNKIKHIIYKPLLDIQKKNDLKGIRVQAEWLYSPFALTREDDSNLVYFVATNYEKDKLGIWSTFPIIDITQANGEPIDDDIKFDIVSTLVNLSDKNVKFLPLDVDAFTPIDLSTETTNALQELKIFQSQNPNYEEILYSDSRKKDDREAKKAMKSLIHRTFLPYQKAMHEKIFSTLSRLKGKLGDYEGFVIQVKDNEGSKFVFKVISPKFHQQKGRI